MSTTTITEGEALSLTDPNAPEDERKRQASVIADGQRANAAYWNSRGDMEQVMARVNGHGVVPSFTDLNSGENGNVIEGNATGERLGGGESEYLPSPQNPDTRGPQTAGAPDPANETDAVARLREQVESLGGTPEV